MESSEQRDLMNHYLTAGEIAPLKSIGKAIEH